MAHYTFVHFDHDEAAYRASLEGIRADLHSVEEWCKHLIAMRDKPSDPYVGMITGHAFSTAIIVTYSRPYVSGVRHRLGEDVLSTLTSTQREQHERLRAWRDKHIAHSVNPFEDNKIQARYDPARVEVDGIIGVSAAHYRVAALSEQDLTDTLDLCRSVLNWVEKRIDQEDQRVLDFIRTFKAQEILKRPSRLPLGELSRIAQRRRT
jgi:hypothetical protein